VATRFRCYDNLRSFTVVARHLSFTAAAEELNLSKGAVSYQISNLETDLGFQVFVRQARGIALTDKGKRLWISCRATFNDLEANIALLRREEHASLTIGMSTYFASRWLSPRLMTFTNCHRDISIRLQPTIGLVDPTLEGIDLLVRWGRGNWTDLQIETLFTCPAIPTASPAIMELVEKNGLQDTLNTVTLLHDYDGSEAWKDWHKAAGLTYKVKHDDLVIPDPNVRVQAVIDGQGVALNDQLVTPEIREEKLVPLCATSMSDYGYFLAYLGNAAANPSFNLFREWILREANKSESPNHANLQS